MHALSGNLVTQLINEKSLATLLSVFVMFLMWSLLKWVMKQQEILMKESKEREEKLFSLFSDLKKQLETMKEESKIAFMRQRTEHETMLRLLNSQSN